MIGRRAMILLLLAFAVLAFMDFVEMTNAPL